MSRFRKVSEIDNIPTFLEKRFIGAQVEVEEDPYAELKRNSTANRQSISKQNIGFFSVIILKLGLFLQL
jgi:hypothetical protein